MWWVATDQGVVSAGPFVSELAATAAYSEVAMALREAMRRDTHSNGRRRYTEADIVDRVDALRVGYGVVLGPHGAFATRKRR